MRFIFLFALTGLTIPALSQNMNVAAVDTLTKDMATAVFANIVGNDNTNASVAKAVYDQLLLCDDGCDPLAIIRDIGGVSWSQVEQKMQEITRLKEMQRFKENSPAEANTAIRQRLAQFYNQYKSNKNYGGPLTPDKQAEMLAKIDRMLPPTQSGTAPEVAAPMGETPATGSAISEEDKSPISSSALTMSKLERSVKDEQDKNFWTMIVSGLIGLVAGAAAVYFLLYRALKSETDQLKSDNAALSRENDMLRRKSDNESRPRNTRQAESFPSLKPAPAVIPLTETPAATVQQPAAPVPPVPASEPTAPTEPTPALTQPVLSETPRDEVLYFPPPSPEGIFDTARQMDRLSPESAYRFEVRSQTPDQATFRFEAEPGRVARFLTYRNYMIEPACDSENSYSSQHTRIVSQREGEAVRENGGWRVVKKALIRYE